MKFLADENVDAPIIEWLRAIGVDVLSARQTMPGTADQQLITVAQQQQRIILTNDLDFGELIYHHSQCTAGVVLLRVRPAIPSIRLAVLQRHWQEVVLKVPGNFIVVTHRKLRVRPIPQTKTPPF